MLFFKFFWWVGCVIFLKFGVFFKKNFIKVNYEFNSDYIFKYDIIQELKLVYKRIFEEFVMLWMDGVIFYLIDEVFFSGCMYFYFSI